MLIIVNVRRRITNGRSSAHCLSLDVPLMAIEFAATTTSCGTATSVYLSGLSPSRRACALATQIRCIKDRLGTARFLGILVSGV